MAIIVDITQATYLKKLLKEEFYYDKRKKCKKNQNNQTLTIPVNDKFYKFINCQIGEVKQLTWKGVSIRTTNEEFEKNEKHRNEPLKLCQQKLKNKNLWVDELEHDLPKSYEKYGDVLLVPLKALNHDIWKNEDNLRLLTECYKCKRIAKKGVIMNNEFRKPQVTLLLGDDGIVQHTENKIIYKYDIRKCMYSPGNITEKIRLSQIDCTNETVVDLYAGIGYFTLPFLVHCNASLVYACEWNPDAIDALKENLKLNKVEGRCIVLQGDNKTTCPVGVANRVNLGLIPSSRDGWVSACKALKSDCGGVLHIHENVEDEDVENIGTDGSFVDVLKRNNNEFYELGNDDNSNIVESDYDIDNINNDNNNNNNEDISKNIKLFNRKKLWTNWANGVCIEIKNILETMHSGSYTWCCSVEHIERVKSYAPHIHHMVVDVKCTPVLLLSNQ